MFSILAALSGNVKAILAGAAGFTAAFALTLAWNTFIDNPRLKRDVRVATEARMSNQFFQAVGDLTDAADAARIRARLCTDTGRVYDFQSGECRGG